MHTNRMPSAIIDLGTNTFHLLIFDKENVLFQQSLAVRMGEGGINDGRITPEALARSIAALSVFKDKLTEYKIADNQVFAFGTSALRSAKNKEGVLSQIKAATGLDIQIIDGMEEARLIYEGVGLAVNIRENTMIVDIGGGSVEFIICNQEKMLWMQSFEIGGQRLLEKFMHKDPIPSSEINKMNEFLREKLLPLSNAVHQYQPKVLVGSSGTFDTLNDMYYQKLYGVNPPADISGFEYPLNEFFMAYETLVFKNRAERMAVPGMRELRVDMIVVAMVLINFLVQNLGIKTIQISNFALKEGAMNRVQNAQ